MHFFAVVAVSLVLVLAVSAAPTNDLPHNDFFLETNECIPYQEFLDQCNFCQCDDEGKGAMCTLMRCQTPKKPHIDGYKDGMSCPSGKTFFDGSKSCTCSESGKSATCTLAADCNVNA